MLNIKSDYYFILWKLWRGKWMFIQAKIIAKEKIIKMLDV